MENLNPDAARRLVAAVILLAARDALQGDDQASTWLAGEGAVWAKEALDIKIDLLQLRLDVVHQAKHAELALLESAMRDAPDATPGELADITGLSVDKVYNCRAKLRRAGRLRPARTLKTE